MTYQFLETPLRLQQMRRPINSLSPDYLVPPGQNVPLILRTMLRLGLSYLLCLQFNKYFVANWRITKGNRSRGKQSEHNKHARRSGNWEQRKENGKKRKSSSECCLLLCLLTPHPASPSPQRPHDGSENCCFIKFLIELKLSSPPGEAAAHQKFDANILHRVQERLLLMAWTKTTPPPHAHPSTQIKA